MTEGQSFLVPGRKKAFRHINLCCRVIGNIQVARRLGMYEAFPWGNCREYLEGLMSDTGMEEVQ